MSDDLDDLKSAFDAATPAPDATRRAANLALAQKNFEALQGSREEPRPSPVTAPKGLWTGLKGMLTSLTSRGALTATTAIAACGFLFLTPVGQGMWTEGDFSAPDDTAPQTDPSESAVAARTEEKVSVEVVAAAPEAPPAPVADVVENPSVRSEAPGIRADLAGSSGVQEGLGVNDTGQANAAAQQLQLSDNTALNDNASEGPSDLSFGEAVAPQPTAVAEPTLGESEELAQAFELQDELAQQAVREREQARAAQPSIGSADSVLSLESDTADLFFGDRDVAFDRSGSDADSEAFWDRLANSSGSLRRIHTPVEIQTTKNTEAYANEASASLQITQETPVSTFSIDVDTASYALLRSSITRGQLPQPEQVRIEELINYFPYDYPAPDAGEAPFRPTVSTMQTPWNADTQLVHIAIQGQMPLVDDRPPLNLVFLIDTSGSMNEPNKLPLLKQSLGLMLGQLRPEDQVAIVEYAGSAGQVLAPTLAADQSTIVDALNTLGAGGSTNGQGGLQQAYAVAESMQTEGEVNRIILATDGDFNVGITDTNALKDFIADKRDTGTYLSVLGFGRGNLDDATMQALAQNGNGQAAYIDTLTEAQKVLVDQLTGELFPIAGDVKIQVEWNPAEVAEYRLIGYETRSLAREDFNNDKVDAGELGAGHSVTAIYEITPVGSPAQLSDPLRYAPTEAAENNGELGFLKLRYKEPGASESQLLTTPIVPTDGASSEAQFAAAIAGFGQLLRDDRFLGEWDYTEAIALANAHRGDDPFGYRTEAVQLMRLTQSLDIAPALRIQGRGIFR